MHGLAKARQLRDHRTFDATVSSIAVVCLYKLVMYKLKRLMSGTSQLFHSYWEFVFSLVIAHGPTIYTPSLNLNY